jgi:two-component system nitrogen regulation sensor histidine kinase NtrY
MASRPEERPGRRPERGELRPRRLPLGPTRRRFGYERRLRLLLWSLSAPLFTLAAALLFHSHASAGLSLLTAAALLLLWALLQSWLAEQFLKPLQTLSNVVAALREGDYSFRARGGRRGDALGDLALEINALANDLQSERLASLESAALVRRVLDVLEAPVLAFDERGFLRLLNPAGTRLLRVRLPQHALGRHAGALGVAHLLTARDEQVATVSFGGEREINATQWMVRRSRFREHGIPHVLLLLSDVSVALRQEEQEAWRRLIRVLGHEINNSLTPIKSLAGSLRSMLAAGVAGHLEAAEFDRPLEVIEERAESLNRFLSAYRQLAQLPPPHRQPVSLGVLLHQLAPLETRLPVHIEGGPELTVLADRDQLAQAVVNLLRNGAEAALENTDRSPTLSLAWSTVTLIEGSVEKTNAVIRLRDSGLGIANPGNLFVPFYTTKQGGTGTGLALVKQIMEAHGGIVTLTNQPEGGTEAQLRLPLENVQQHEQHHQQQNRADSTGPVIAPVAAVRP